VWSSRTMKDWVKRMMKMAWEREDTAFRSVRATGRRGWISVGDTPVGQRGRGHRNVGRVSLCTVWVAWVWVTAFGCVVEVIPWGELPSAPPPSPSDPPGHGPLLVTLRHQLRHRLRRVHHLPPASDQSGERAGVVGAAALGPDPG